MKKTVLITGANRGIGLELTRHYIEQGARVIAVCRGEFPEPHTPVHQLICPIDVSQPQDIQHLVQTVGDQTIDILINNAGILCNETLESMDFSHIEQQFTVNALGPLRVTHSLLGNLKAGSKVIVITSRMGSIADNTTGGRYGYRASKAALNAFSVSLACDLKPFNIVVGILHPGYVQTDMTAKSGDVSPATSAANLAARVEAVTLNNSGHFFHANGSELPW